MAGVLKTGEVMKLQSGGFLSKLTKKWKAKIATVSDDGSITYTDLPGKGRDSTTLPILPGGTGSLPPALLVSALLVLEEPFPSAAVFTVHVVEEYDEPPRELVFIANDEADAADWNRAITQAGGSLTTAPPCGPKVAGAAKSLNYYPKSDALKAAKGEAGKGASAQAVLRELRVPKAVRGLLDSTAQGSSKMDVASLAEILQVSEEEAGKRVAAADHGDAAEKVVDAAVLRELLCARENSVMVPAAVEMGDMTRPMSDYFVCSSHNTYLTGDQVMSSSAAEMYRVVLERGVRCVELDLWDGDDGPVITHGNTATSKLPLKTASDTIAHFAFVASEYPLILSLENHLSLPNQVIAAKMFEESFGETLHVIKLADGEALPSPQEMKGKVLIKAKMGEWAHESMDSEDSGDEDDDSCEFGGAGGSDTPSKKLSVKKKVSPRSAGTPSDEPEDISKPSRMSSIKQKISPKNKDKKKHLPIAKELAAITSFGGANRKKLLALWDEGKLHPVGQLDSDIVSINETKVEGVYTSGKMGSLQAYNTRNMTRIYPKASRVDSSNYNPMAAWNAGCQIVAMNYQTEDMGLWLNHGRFAVNARCGFVPKPEFAIAGGPVSGAGMLAITVVAGSLLPRSPTSVRGGRDWADPYVQLVLARAGPDGEPIMAEQKTESVDCNGLCPSWGESFSFKVGSAEIDVIAACVWDDDTASKDDMIGFFAAPVGALRTGTRAMHLCAPDGVPLRVPGTSELPTIVVDVQWTPGEVADAAGASADSAAKGGK